MIASRLAVWWRAMHTLLVAALLTISLQDQFEGAEIGDATHAQTFRTDGRYVYEETDPQGAVKTEATGKWKVDGNAIDVRITSCKGNGCAALGKGFRADVDLVAERAMLVNSKPSQSPLATGSYYCHYQGCEKRTGIAVVSHGARPNVMRYLVDFLVDKNRSRNVTVVWWAKKADAPQTKTTLTWCKRDEARAKVGAE